MTNVLTESLLRKYVESLAQDEDTIEEAAAAFETAKVRLDVGLRRYIALRDYVTEQLGKSPYALEHYMWPVSSYDDDGAPYWKARGHFRFSGMAVGDAVLQVLREHRQQSPETPANKRWLRLSAIIEALSAGGLGFPEPAQARAVNAALLKTTGVKRGTLNNEAKETVYWVDDDEREGGESDPDDLPFE